MRVTPIFLYIVVISWIALPISATADPDANVLIQRIQAVGREGAGNKEATEAWRELVRLGPDAVFHILPAFDQADPVAANWLRSAVDAVAERELAKNKLLPAGAPTRLLPNMLDDPGEELRRDANAFALQNAKQLVDKNEKPAAIAAYRTLLRSARDRDQVESIAKTLKTLGEPVDLTAQFGFITRWKLIGPFDNSGGAGFQTAYPPEKNVDPTPTYQGKKNQSLKWKEQTTADPYGIVDLNKALGKHMGATGYAFAAVDSSQDRPVQLRAGSNNAVKIFLNGRQIYFREEYHHGMRMDQHVGHGTLKAGRNEILVKVCQNEQTEDWAQLWSFQLRLCDDLGGPVPLKVVDPLSK